MNYRLLVIEAIALVITGGISSFIYIYATYTNKRIISKLFVPKNDSIWEHIKVVLALILVLTVIEFCCFNVTTNFIFAKFLTTLFIIVFIPITFLILYRFSIWDMLKINITSNILSIIFGFLVFMFLLNITELPIFIAVISSIGFCGIIAFYIVATFYPTTDFIFLDPETKKARIKKDE